MTGLSQKNTTLGEGGTIVNYNHQKHITSGTREKEKTPLGNEELKAKVRKGGRGGGER